MADSSLGIIAIVGGIGAAAFAGYEYMHHSAASAGTGAQAQPTPAGFQPPANLLQMMQAAFWLKGSPNGWAGRTTWIDAMNSVVPAAGAGAWGYVWQQWQAVYSQNGSWPSNTQLQGWLKYAVDNGISA